MPARIKSRTPKHFGVFGLLFACDGRSIGWIEADDDNVVIDARLHRNPTQTGDGFPQTHGAKTGALEIHQLEHDRLLAEVGSKRYSLPVLVVEHQVERNRRVEL